jgi:hypothetical protein
MKRDYLPNLLPINALHILLNKFLRNLTQLDPFITMQLFFIVLQMNLQRNLLIPVSVVTNKYIPYIVKFVFYKGICQFHFDVKVVKSRGESAKQKQWNRNQQNKNNRGFRQNRKQELK